MGLLDFLKNKNPSIDTKHVLKILGFSIILPPDWIDDTSDKHVLAVYRKVGDSGVIQISTFTKEDKKGIDPKQSLRDYLKDETIKIKTYERNNSKYALSDYYLSDNMFCRAMVVDKNDRHAFITYNVEEKFKNAYLKDVDEIFDSFMFD